MAGQFKLRWSFALSRELAEGFAYTANHTVTTPPEHFCKHGASYVHNGPCVLGNPQPVNIHIGGNIQDNVPQQCNQVEEHLECLGL